MPTWVNWRKQWRAALKKCREEQPDFGADRTDLGYEVKPGRQFHGLRTTAVTRLMDAGLTDKTVSRLTGHKNPGMIAHYNRPGEEQFKREMEKCPILRLVS